MWGGSDGVVMECRCVGTGWAVMECRCALPEVLRF